MHEDGAPGRFSARLTPARVATLDGELPLSHDTWELRLRRAGESASTPVMVAERCTTSSRWSPWSTTSRSGSGMDADGAVILAVRIDLDSDERGRDRQRRLRATVYQPGRSEPLRDTVVYTSFRGRQYSDNPRAIHEELVRRDAPLEHLWVVGDQACRVPPTATVVRAGSREHYERARARALRGRERPLPGLVRAAARPALPADVARHAAQAARLRRLQPAGRDPPLRAPLAAPPDQLAVRALPQPLLHADPAAGVRDHGRDARDRLPPQRRARARRPRRAGRARAGAARAAGGRARRALRPDVPRPRPRRPRPLPARAGARGRAPPRRARARHGGPVPQAPLHRRPRAGDRGRLRARRLDLSRRDRAAARRRRARHRLLLDDVRLRQHRPADAVLHVRPRGVPRRDPRLLLRLRRQGARPAARRPATSSRRRSRTSTRSPPRTRAAIRTSCRPSASSTTAAPPSGSSTCCSVPAHRWPPGSGRPPTLPDGRG